MIRRTLVASVAVVVALGSSAVARPVFSQLTLTTTTGTASQDRTIGNDPRTADDFAFQGTANGTQRLQYVQVLMIGRGTQGVLPSLSKFGFTIYSNNLLFPNRPGAAMFTKLGASTVQDRGAIAVGSPYRRYLVSFVIPYPAPSPILRNNTRYWVSGFGRLDDSNTWLFGTLADPSAMYPAAYTPNLAAFGFSPLPVSYGSKSFTIGAF